MYCFSPFLPPAVSYIYTFSLLFFSCFFLPPFFPSTWDYFCARNCSSNAVSCCVWTHTVPSSREQERSKMVAICLHISLRCCITSSLHIDCIVIGRMGMIRWSQWIWRGSDISKLMKWGRHYWVDSGQHTERCSVAGFVAQGLRQGRPRWLTKRTKPYFQGGTLITRTVRRRSTELIKKLLCFRRARASGFLYFD